MPPAVAATPVAVAVDAQQAAAAAAAAIKPATTFRNYTNEETDQDGTKSRMDVVRKLYKEQHAKQTYDSVVELEKRYFSKWGGKDNNTHTHTHNTHTHNEGHETPNSTSTVSPPTSTITTISDVTPPSGNPTTTTTTTTTTCSAPLLMGAWTALEYLDQVIDDSDPDTELSQVQHALQAAEAARVKFPDQDWMHLTALIHDLGKILSVVDPVRGLRGEPQYAVVGDTFPVGCAFEDSNIYPEYFQENPDFNHPQYSTKLGIYKEHCGLRNVKMSFGHDEYFYQVLANNGCRLPAPALACVRFHSFYPWHERGGYRHLCDETDEENLKWVKAFNSCDLYSKADEPCNVAELKPYYMGLIDKYLPAVLLW